MTDNNIATRTEQASPPEWTKIELDLEFDGANFEAVDSTNSHNEGNVRVSCDKEDYFNDEIAISTYRAFNEFNFQIYVNSEVKIGLWKNGYLNFAYDMDVGLWKFSGHASGAEWLFCEPKMAVSIVLESIRCLVGTTDPEVSEEDRAAVQTIADRIKEDLDNIVSSARLYTKNDDCVKPDPTAIESFKDYFIESSIRTVEACTESMGLACPY